MSLLIQTTYSNPIHSTKTESRNCIIILAPIMDTLIHLYRQRDHRKFTVSHMVGEGKNYFSFVHFSAWCVCFLLLRIQITSLLVDGYERSIEYKKNIRSEKKKNFQRILYRPVASKI